MKCRRWAACRRRTPAVPYGRGSARALAWGMRRFTPAPRLPAPHMDFPYLGTPRRTSLERPDSCVQLISTASSFSAAYRRDDDGLMHPLPGPCSATTPPASADKLTLPGDWSWHRVGQLHRNLCFDALALTFEVPSRPLDVPQLHTSPCLLAATPPGYSVPPR